MIYFNGSSKFEVSDSGLCVVTKFEIKIFVFHSDVIIAFLLLTLLTFCKLCSVCV